MKVRIIKTLINFTFNASHFEITGDYDRKRKGKSKYDPDTEDENLDSDEDSDDPFVGEPFRKILKTLLFK